MLIIFIFIFVLIVVEGQEVETWERPTKRMLYRQIRHYSILYSYNVRICVSESQVNAEMFATITFEIIRINSHRFKTTRLFFQFMPLTES
jgi:hypothetical protein